MEDTQNEMTNIHNVIFVLPNVMEKSQNALSFVPNVITKGLYVM